MICCKCKSQQVIKKGKRKTKQGMVQRYWCKNCRHLFVHRLFKHKTYGAALIRAAITLYNQGFTLEEVTRLVSRRFKVRISRSSVHRWVDEQRTCCTYSLLRAGMVKRYGKDLVVSKPFEYQGLAYNFKYHVGKLGLCGEQFPSLASYIQRCGEGTPSFFDSITHRCSRFRLRVDIHKKVSEHLVCAQTGLALGTVASKKMRHSLVETFLLVNDHTTVAVEVPIWFWEKRLDIGIAGHIDVVQVHEGLVYILDYKPEAAREKDEYVASQLFLYARGLSFRASLPLCRIRCGWFDEQLYVEFEPDKAEVQYR